MKNKNNTVSSDNLEIVVCRELGELDRYAGEWDRLLDGCPQRSPMLSYAWVTSYLEHRLDAGQDWYVVLALSNDRLIGVLPVIVTPFTKLGKACPILSTPNDSHTMGGDALVAGDAPDDVICRIITAAQNEAPGHFMFKLHRVVERSPTLRAVKKLRGSKVITKSAGIGYYFPVNGDFEEYYQTLSKKFRGNLRRAENNLQKLVPNRVMIIEREGYEDRYFTWFTELEASGWKGRQGSAIIKSPELEAFYRTLVRKLEQSGMLRWEFLLGENDHLLAANLSIRFGDIVVVWKLGYDEEYGKYSPGAQLFRNIMERAFPDDSISEFNLMSDTPWQKNWNPGIYDYHTALIYPNKKTSIIYGYIPMNIKLYIKKRKFITKIVSHLKNKKYV